MPLGLTESSPSSKPSSSTEGAATRTSTRAGGGILRAEGELLDVRGRGEGERDAGLDARVRPGDGRAPEGERAQGDPERRSRARGGGGVLRARGGRGPRDDPEAAHLERSLLVLNDAGARTVDEDARHVEGPSAARTPVTSIASSPASSKASA